MYVPNDWDQGRSSIDLFPKVVGLDFSLHVKKRPTWPPTFQSPSANLFGAMILEEKFLDRQIAQAANCSPRAVTFDTTAPRNGAGRQSSLTPAMREILGTSWRSLPNISTN